MKDFLDELDNELDGMSLSPAPEAQKKEIPKTQPQKPTSHNTQPQKTFPPRNPREGWHAPKKTFPPRNPQQNFASAWAKNPQTGNQESSGDTEEDFFDDKHDGPSMKGGRMVQFPEIKFYLPTLREGYTRFIPVWGNNETGGKNMGLFQYWDDLLLVDGGLQFADPHLFGANYSIPDISFLTKYTKNIKALLITHAHLDHIGALKHLLPALDFPVIYATRFTNGLIRKSLEEHKILDKATLIDVDASTGEMLHIGPFKVEFFNVNHSVPDCAGLYIESPGGTKFFHTGDFKIDFHPAIDVPSNLNRYAEIGKRGITMMLSDSTWALKKGFSMSEKNVGETLEKIVANHTKGRLIIATFSSWISRIQQLLDICEKHDKYMFLSGKSMVENVAIAKELWYLNVKPHIMKKMTPKNTEGIPAYKQIIITTGSQGEQFSALTRMAEGKHNSIEIVAGDTVVFSSSVVPWNERAVVGTINKLIRLWANVITKDDGEVHTGGHGFQEDQKLMYRLVKPKYFCPIHGDLYFRTIHKNTIVGMGMKEENILFLDNGSIIDFAPNGSVFRSKIKVPIQEIIIDGHGIGTSTSHVIKAREKMMNSGVLVVSYKVDRRTKALLGHIKIETRGLVYLDEVRFLHRAIIKKAKEAYENTIKDVPDIEEKDLLKLVRTDLETFILKRIDREPMIIPMLIEV